MTAGFLNRRQVLVTGTPVLAGSTLASTRNGTVHVTIDKLAFLPAEIEVKAGETIDWTNKDPVAHTPTVKGGWDALIPPGKMATSVAAAADTGEYYCRFHPNLKGQVKVVGWRKALPGEGARQFPGVACRYSAAPHLA